MYILEIPVISTEWGFESHPITTSSTSRSSNRGYRAYWKEYGVDERYLWLSTYTGCLSLPRSGSDNSVDAVYVHSVLSTLLTQWRRVVLEKLTGSQLVKKFPAFYETWRFITAYANACHLSFIWDRPRQSHALTTHVLNIHMNIILPATPGSSKWSLSLRFPHQNSVYISPLTQVCYMTLQTHPSGFDNPNNNICFPNYLDSLTFNFWIPGWLQRACYTQGTILFPARSLESLITTCQNEIKWNANLMQLGHHIDVFSARHVSGTYAHHQEH